MFKIESYVTPLILSYVDKYIKNIKPEDSQVSLWGGDAVFHNLDLRLDVLEKELNSPFTISSGHIHELKIHVPWTKLGSEPIVITINTIECTLKLKTFEDRMSETSSVGRTKSRRQDLANPPGYIHSLLNKIASNISIVCNNAIFKYLEEDIVLSLNAKTISLTSVDNNWEQAFTELTMPDLILRKLISVSDLTICLDRCNAHGKIAAYQEPFLYRNSFSVRASLSYASLKSSQASKIRIDVHFPKLDFSLSDQQLPMFLRLFKLCLGLYLGDFKSKSRPGAPETENNQLSPSPEENEANEEGGTTWASWAWSYVPSLLPVYWEDEEERNKSMAENRKDRVLEVGLFIERVAVTFKWAELTREKNSYGPARLRFRPFLTLRLQGCCLQTVSSGIDWVNVQGGISHVILEPVSECLCGSCEDTSFYLLQGCERTAFIQGSLFDPVSAENLNDPRHRIYHWEHHIQSVTESTLLERTPAMGFDYLYKLELAEDYNSELLSQLGSDLEFSNFPERALLRLAVGPMQIKVSYGLCHRVAGLSFAVNQYSYPDYAVPGSGEVEITPTALKELLDMQNNLPSRVYQVAIMRPLITVTLSPQHANFDLQRLMEKRSLRPKPSSIDTKNLPVLIAAAACIDVQFSRPMYPDRLVRSLRILQNAPSNLLQKAYSQTKIKSSDFSLRLVSEEKQISLIEPWSGSLVIQSLLLPELWKEPERVLNSATLETNVLEAAFSKPQLNYVTEAFQQLSGKNSGSRILKDLGEDSVNDITFFALRTKVKDFRIHYVKTAAVSCLCVSLGALELTAENPYEKHTILNKHPTDELFIDFLIQVPSHLINPGESPGENVPVLNLRMEAANVTYHPQLFHWLNYEPRKQLIGQQISANEDLNLSSSHPSSQSIYGKDSGLSSSLGGVTGLSSGALLTFPAKIVPENVPEKRRLDWKAILEELQKSVFHVEFQNSTFTFGVNEYTKIVFTLPSMELSCAAAKTSRENPAIPFSFQRKSTFPWTLSLKNFSVSTNRILKDQPLVQPMSLTCTIALSPVAKPGNILDLCIHADFSAIHLGVTVEQMELICRILGSLKLGLQTATKEKSSSEIHIANIGLWMQLAVPRLVYEFSSHEGKLLIDMEDFTTSADLQDVYVKLSSKLTSLYVKYFVKSGENWIPDPAVNGIVITCGDDITRNFHFLTDRSDPGGFHQNCTPLPSPVLSDPSYGTNPYSGKHSGGVGLVTWTKAKRSHARKKWQENLKSEENPAGSENEKEIEMSDNNFLSEINFNVEPIDVILTPALIKHITEFMEPLKLLENMTRTDTADPEENTPLSSHSLPLLFANTKPLRVFLVQPNNYFLLLNIESMEINPRGENPLERCSVLKQEMFTEAANSGELYVPGSDIEDRQYQVDIGGISLGAGYCWSDVAKASWLCRMGSQTSALHTMAENPALEWNVGEFFTKEIFLSPVLSRTDLRILYAPCVYSLRDKCIVAGQMSEINFHSNLKFYLNLAFKDSFLNPWIETFQNFSSKIPDFQDPEKLENLEKNPENFLVTTGRIEMFIYEDSSEGNEILPLVYTRIDQPHYVCRISTEETQEFSVFNIRVQGPGSFAKILKPLPGETDFANEFLETKPGIPGSKTGFPPSFFTLRKNPSRISVLFGRPVKFNVRKTILKDLQFVQDRILRIGGNREPNSGPKTEPEVPGFADFEICTAQVAAELFIEENCRILAGFESLNVNLKSSKGTNHCKSFQSSFQIDSFTVKSELNKTNCLLVDPWNLEGDFEIRYPHWLGNNQFLANALLSGTNLKLHLRPKDLELLEKLVKFSREVFPVAGRIDAPAITNEEEPVAKVAENEQHYQDDLRAGAFDFQIRDPRNSPEAKGEIYPGPYQVIFTVDPASMCWAYPQPRALTRLDVYPIPLMQADVHANDSSVDCALQYWQESRKQFKTLRSFKLSETQLTRVKLPKVMVHQQTNGEETIDEDFEAVPVSSLWRIVMNFTEDGLPESRPKSIIAAPPSLVACTRVDSYFCPRLIPAVQVSGNLSELSLTLHVQTEGLAKEWKVFRQDNALPAEFPCYVFRFDNLNLDFQQNQSEKTSLVSASGNARLCSLNFATLADDFIVDPTDWETEILLNEDSVKGFVKCRKLHCNFSQSIYHSMVSGLAAWNPRTTGEKIIFAPYLILNDTQEALRIGQSETGESVLLLPRQCHQYSWKSLEKNKTNKIQICMEGSKWRWCDPCSLEEDGIFVKNVKENGETFPLILRVKTLDPVHKEITIQGQIIASSLLSQVLEVRLVPQKDSPAQVREMRAPLNPKSCSPSFIFPLQHLQGIKVRLPGGTWSGLIPYSTNNQARPIVLVRVPQKDRDEDLNIWCHLWTEKVDNKSHRLLILMAPLYTVRSYMPLSMRLHVKTPGVGSSVWVQVNGQGSDNILSCPGSVDHTHQLSFQLSPELPESTPPVPLNWTMSSQYSNTQSLPKDPTPFIDDLLEEIFTDPGTRWPGTLATNSPTEVVQPKTDVRVTFSTLGPRCHTLLVELKPWALLMNQSGADLYLTSSSDYSHWPIPNGVTLAPPPLPSTFQIGFYKKETYFYSKPLLLQDQESSGFMSYRPRLEGTLSPEGFCCTHVILDDKVCFLTLSSTMQNGIRVIRIKSTFQIVNQTESSIFVATLAKPKTSALVAVEKENWFEQLFECGGSRTNLPLLYWNSSTPEVEGLFLAFRACSELSCPVAIDPPSIRGSTASRICLSIPLSLHNKDHIQPATFPMILTRHEESGIVHLTLNPDPTPLWIIVNKTKDPLAYAQASDTRPGEVESHCEGFHWTGTLFPSSVVHYTPPWANQRFPDLSPPTNMPRLVLSAMNEGKVLGWSSPVHPCLAYDQFVSLPKYHDVMIRILKTEQPNQTAVIIEPLSRVEISAKEIRGRILEDPGREIITSGISQILPEVPVPEVIHQKKPEVILCQWISLHENAKKSLKFLESGNQDLSRKFQFYFEEISVLFRQETMNDFREILRVTADHTIFDFVWESIIDNQSIRLPSLRIYIANLQVDNQLYQSDPESNMYDFPVILLSQSDYSDIDSSYSGIRDKCLLRMDLLLRPSTWEVNSAEFRFKPVILSIEDRLVSVLQDYFSSYLSVNKWEVSTEDQRPSLGSLHLDRLLIDDVSLDLSLRSYSTLYIALDHSPLRLKPFDRSFISTTPFRLGQAVAMHYISSALFKAGWVVGSLELLGSPTALARSVTSGIKDFVKLPYEGIWQGPRGFLAGVVNGSSSLVTHVTAGTLTSVTQLASSVARNVDRLSCDAEFQHRSEEGRRKKPQTLVQGLGRGLSAFGISLLGAIGGLAHHPLESVLQERPSARNLAVGVTKGLIGVFAKPISGAADFVAHAGQGLLNASQWNAPFQVKCPGEVLERDFGMLSYGSARILWKIGDETPLTVQFEGSRIVCCLEAMKIKGLETVNRISPVLLVVSTGTLCILNAQDGEVQAVFELQDVESYADEDDHTLITIKPNLFPTPGAADRRDEETNPHYDPKRVEEFVRQTTPHVLPSARPEPEPELQQPVMKVMVNPKSKQYFLSCFGSAKKRKEGYGFPLL